MVIRELIGSDEPVAVSEVLRWDGIRESVLDVLAGRGGEKRFDLPGEADGHGHCECRSAQSPFDHAGMLLHSPRLIIYGVNPVLEALRSHPQRIHYIGVARDHGGKAGRVVAEAKKAGVAVRMMPAEQIDRIAGRGVHNGVVSDLSASTYADFDDAVETADFVLILDGITDPQNLGAILRVADGFGVQLVVLPEHDSVGLTPVAVKASAGAGGGGAGGPGAELTPGIANMHKKGVSGSRGAPGGGAAPAVGLR